MKRREFVGRLGVGSAALVSVSGAAAATGKQDEHQGHGPSDPNSTNASVSFGAWPTGGASPTNRFALPAAPQAPNVHELFPHVTTIKAGSSVNFIVAGFHLIAIYGPGTKFEDVDGTNTSPLPGAPAPDFPPFVDDQLNRIYLGLNPLTTNQDRVEVVHFPNRGTYLVVCAFLPHFNGGMHGYVRVLP